MTSLPLTTMLLLGLLLGLVSGETVSAREAAQPGGPARCHWVGRATKSPERLSASQFLVRMTVERDLTASGSPPDMVRSPVSSPDEASVIVNSTYGASYYRAFDIKTGTELEIAGYVRVGGQCVVDTLNIGTLEPGFEGYLLPPDTCPTAGEETIAVYAKAARSLGCAVAPMFTAPTALQRFQRGVMLHLKGIYVLQYDPIPGLPPDSGPWTGTRDTYREPEPAQIGLPTPEPGLIEPRLGFGKAWREQYGGPDGSLGWAIEEESTTDASWQLFERGIVVVTRAGDGLILYHDGRVWEYRSR
jgi:hypothetical protein